VQGTATSMNPELKPTSKIELDKQPDTTDVARIVTNQPELKKRKEGFSTREKVFATLGALGLLGGGAVAANHLSSNSAVDVDKNPSATGPETAGAVETTAPSAEATPSPYSSPANTEALNTAQPVIDTLPTDVIESGLFEGLSSEKQAEIKSLDSMTVEQFRDQPLEKQLMFAQFAYDNNAPRVLQEMRNLGFDMEDYANRITTPSQESSPQEVTDHVSIVLDVAGSLYSADNTYDVDTARKMMSLSLNTSTSAFADYDEYLQNRPTGLSMATSTNITASKTFEAQDGTQMKVNSINQEGEDAQTTFEHIQFTDIQGQEKSTWRRVLSITSSDSRYDTSVK